MAFGADLPRAAIQKLRKNMSADDNAAPTEAQLKLQEKLRSQVAQI